MDDDLAIELLNSSDLDAGVLAGWGLDPGRPLRPREVTALRELRTLLRRLAEALAERGRLAPDELAALNEVIGRTPVRAQLWEAPSGAYLVDMQPVGAPSWEEHAVRELAGSFAALLRRAHPSRLRLCESCGRAFWDASKNRSRRWCDTRTCGNRVRVARHRARAQR